MAFCTKCGTETQGKFCPSCGTPMGGPASAGTAAAPSTSTSVDLEEHIVNALCYLVWPLTGVLFLVLEPYSRNRSIRFHAFQSIFTFAALLVVSIALSTLGVIIPFFGWILVTLGWTVFPLACVVLWIILVVKAYNKERWVLPIVGPLAEKQA